jgi:hypothetical protein
LTFKIRSEEVNLKFNAAKRMRLQIAAVVLICTCFCCYGQQTEKQKIGYNFGLGLGFDFGGLGGRAVVLPVKSLGIFGAAGYNFQRPAFNLGLLYRLFPEQTLTPTFLAMYGYNGVIVVRGGNQYSRTYYGPTLGTGIEWHKKRIPYYFSFEVFLPFRSKKFRDDYDALRGNAGISGLNAPRVVTIALGYHVKF